MHYTDSGGTSNEALVLLHAGIFADWFVPLDEQPVLADVRRIQVIRTGYLNDPPATPMSIQDHVRESADLLRALGIDRVRLVAHSAGVVYALQMALDYPDLVTDLVLSEPPLINPLMPVEDHAAVGAVLGPVLGSAVQAAISGDLAAAFDTAMTGLCGRGYPDAIAAALGSAGLMQAQANCGYFFTGEITAVNQWHFDQELAQRIEQPVHLVGGGDSPPFTHNVLSYLARILPHADSTYLLGQNHLLPLTAPAELARLVAAHSTREPALESA